MISATKKFCPHCGKRLQAGALECPSCGRSVAAGSPAQSPTQPAGVAGTYAQDLDTTVIYRGRLSRIVLFWPAVVLWLGVGLAILLLVLHGEIFDVLPAFLRPANPPQINPFNLSLPVMLYIALGIVLAVLIYYLFPWIKYRSQTYLITNDRLEREYGVFSRTIINTDLWRIKDLSFTATLGQKILGTGILHVTSSDPREGAFDLGPLPRARALYHALKVYQMQADRRQGVVHIEQ